MIPTYYRNCEKNVDESIPLGKYPTCAWSSDSYTNWLTQQSVNMSSKVINTLASTVATSAANPVLGLVSISANIASTIGAFKEASLLPNNNHGQNTGDVNFSAKDNTFSSKCMRIKTEYLQIVDDYFSRFRLQNKQNKNTKYNR